MGTLKIEQFDQVIGLTELENTQINGGGFWRDVAYVLGVTAQCLEVFAVEGGRNAGICVK